MCEGEFEQTISGLSNSLECPYNIRHFFFVVSIVVAYLNIVGFFSVAVYPTRFDPFTDLKS